MTTKYFRNFSLTDYRFGDNENPVLFDNITQYVDLIDGLKDDISFYQKHTIISGDRADTLSYRLYGTTDYYWTFFLMNDSLRLSGWPVSQQNLFGNITEKYPYRIVTTNSDISNSFPVGQIVTGTQSGTVGRVVRRIPDLGQLVIDTSLTPGNNFGNLPNLENFGQTETLIYLSAEGETFTATLIKESEQYNAVHHYEDTDGLYQDIPIYDFGNTGQLKPVTYRDRAERKNDELKQIIILKPEVIDKVVAEFNNFHKGV
jgi:hypothetical protein